METITLPPHVIESHVETVQHPAHRENLYSHLGRLAEKHTAIDFAADQSETASETPIIHTQSEMISHYFAEASAELGEEATEDQIWDMVFDMQMRELVSPDAEVDKESLAVNVLVGNVFAANGLSETDAQKVLQKKNVGRCQISRGPSNTGCSK